MTAQDATEDTDPDIKVQLELYPENSSEMEIRQVVVGMNPLVLVSAPGDGTVGVTVSSMTAEQALDFLSFAKLALHQYLATEDTEADPGGTGE